MPIDRSKTYGCKNAAVMHEESGSASRVRILFGRNRRNKLGMYAESLTNEETIKALNDKGIPSRNAFIVIMLADLAARTEPYKVR